MDGRNFSRECARRFVCGCPRRDDRGIAVPVGTTATAIAIATDNASSFWAFSGSLRTGMNIVSMSGSPSVDCHEGWRHRGKQGTAGGTIMSLVDREQRIEEIELGLAQLFASPRMPDVRSYWEGSYLYIQLSWVVESTRDTSLDSRCVVTLRFSGQQIDRYAALETAKRNVFRERLGSFVRQHFDERYNPPPLQGDCSVELDLDDALFEWQGA
jgi:hypothetical protein